MGTSYNLVWVQKDFGTTRYEDHETETRTPAEQASGVVGWERTSLPRWSNV